MDLNVAWCGSVMVSNNNNDDGDDGDGNGKNIYIKTQITDSNRFC